MKCELSRPKTNLQKIITILYGPACKMVVLSCAPIVIMLLSFLYWAILKSILCSLQYRPRPGTAFTKSFTAKIPFRVSLLQTYFFRRDAPTQPTRLNTFTLAIILSFVLGGSGGGGGGSGGGVRTLLIMIKSCYDHTITNTGKPLCADTPYARI